MSLPSCGGGSSSNGAETGGGTGTDTRADTSATSTGATTGSTDASATTGSTGTTPGDTTGSDLCDWERRFENPLDPLSSTATNLLVLEDGALMAGTHTVEDANPGYPSVAYVRRLDLDGTEQWSWLGTEVTANTRVRGLVPAEGDGFVVLVTTPDEATPAALVGLASNGEPQWSEPVDVDTLALAREDDSLWLGGVVAGNTPADPHLAQHALDGSLVSSFPLTSLAGTREQPLAAAANMVVFLGGRVWETEQTTSATLGFVRAIDTAGTELWGQLVDPVDGSDTEIHALAPDPDGGVVAVGLTSHSTFNTELYVSRWSSDGTLKWERYWSGDLVPNINVFERGNGVAVGLDGTVWVAGSRLVAATGDDKLDMLLAAWSADGDFIGHRMWGEPASNLDAATTLGFDTLGQLWIVGAWGHVDAVRTDAWIGCEDPTAIVWD